MICLSDEHPSKALSPIDDTESGINIWVKLTQLIKAPLPIKVTEDGIEI